MSEQRFDPRIMDTVHRKESSDFWQVPWKTHRDVLVADVNQPIPRRLKTIGGGALNANPLFMAGGALHLIKMWMSDTVPGQTGKFRVYSIGSPQRPNAPPTNDLTALQHQEWPSGELICDFNIDFAGGATPPGFHPVTHEAITAASGEWWLEPSSGFAENYRRQDDEFRVFNSDASVTPVSEIQEITQNRSAGQWQFSLDGVEFTGDLAWNVSTADLQTALRALDAFPGDSVDVTGVAGTNYIFTFEDALSSQEITLIQWQDGTTPLSGGTAPTIARNTAGSYRALMFLWDMMGMYAGYIEPYDLDNGSRIIIATKPVQ